MHLAGYAALGLPFTYMPFAVQRDLAGALAGMRALGIRGFGVSMPFKIEVLPLLDRVDPLAARIGAVNTIVNDDGILTGYNTDAAGALRALEEVVDPAAQRVVVIGAGGAARAVVHGLASAGARIHVVNRTVSKAQELAQQAGSQVSAGDLAALADLSACDVIVNCSSAGMAGYGPSPLPRDSLRPELVVMDIVYKPVVTPLISMAQEVGCRTVHGGRMLLHQACRQFELYTLRPAPLAVMDGALRQALDS
jgi:shikimate dehydrogenase